MPINSLTPLKENILPQNIDIPIGSTVPSPYKDQGTISTPVIDHPDFMPPPPKAGEELPAMVTSGELYGARRYKMYDPSKTENDYRWGQSGWDRAVNVADNFVEKTGAYLTQAVGFVGGAPFAAAGGLYNLANKYVFDGDGKAINNGNAISFMTDNFLNKLGDAWKENVQERSPIYKSDRYTTGNIFQKLSTADWWQDDAIDRLALTASMLIPGFAEARGVGLFGAMVDAETGALRATGLASKGMQVLADNPGMYNKLGKALGNQIYKTFADGVVDLGGTNVAMDRALAFKNAIQTAQKVELYSWNAIGQSALNGREAQVAIRKELYEQQKNGLNHLSDAEIEDKAALGAALGVGLTLPLSLAGSLYELPQIFSTAKMGESMLKKFFNPNTGAMLEGALEKTVRPTLGKIAGKMALTGLEHGQNESAQVAIGRYLEEAIAGKTVKAKDGTESVEIDDRNPFIALAKNFIDNINDPNGQNNIALGTIQGMLMTGFGHAKALKAGEYTKEDARNRQFINSINQGIAVRRYLTTPEDFYEMKDGKVVLDENNHPKWDNQKLAQMGASFADASIDYEKRLEAIKNNDKQTLNELNFKSLSALAKNFFDDPKGMDYLTNMLRFEAKNQRENPDRKNDTVDGIEINPDIQLQENIEYVKNLKKAYDAIENRHAGFTYLDVDLTNEDAIKEANEYINDVKQAQYRNAGEQIYLNNAILKNKLQLTSLGISESVENTDPLREQANAVIKETSYLENRLEDAKAEYKNLVDKKQFKENGFQAWKEQRVTDSQRVDDIKSNKRKEKVATIESKDGSLDLNVGEEYSLTTPLLNENDQLHLSPKLTILDKASTGELKVKLPTGEITYMKPSEFKRYSISTQTNTSDEFTNMLDKAIDNILNKPEYAAIKQELAQYSPKSVYDKLNFINSINNNTLINAVEKEFNNQAAALLAQREATRKSQQLLLKSKEQLDKQQAKLQLNSGDIGTGNPTEESDLPEEDQTEEGKLKATDIFYISGISEFETEQNANSAAPHVKNARVFLNNINSFKNRSNLRAILVTPNNEAALGLEGLTKLSYGSNSLEGSTDVNNGFVAQVFVEQENGKTYFVDKDGKRINNTEVGTPVDVNQVIFQTMPTTKINDGRGLPRYRKGQKEKLVAQSNAWKEFREQLFKSTGAEFIPYPFNVSRGIGIKNPNTEKNHVGETLIPNTTSAAAEKIIATTPEIIQISASGSIVHKGQSLKFPKGRPVFQLGDVLQFLNNSIFGKDKATTIFQVIKAFAKDIQDQSDAGKEIELNAKLVTYLQNVLYFRKTDKTSSNQIFIDTNNMTISLGGQSYPISEIANNEAKIISQLTNTYHSINKESLKKENINKPFYEYVYKNGKLEESKWKNYQSYLLSSKEADKKTDRSVENTPLVTGIAKPDSGRPYSFEQKYATLQGVDMPVQQAKPEAPEVKEGVLKVGKYTIDGDTLNTFEGRAGDIQFTAKLDPNNPGEFIVKVIPNEVTDKLAAPNSDGSSNATVVAMIDILKSDNKLDPLADDKAIILDGLNNKIGSDIKAAYLEQQENIIKPEIKEEIIKPEEPTKEIKPNTGKAPTDEYRRVEQTGTTKPRLTDAEITFFKEYAKKKAPQFPIEVLEQLVKTYDNKEAYGVFVDGFIKFYKGAIKGTEYHELAEAIWNTFLTPEEQNAIIDNEIERNAGKTFVDRESGKTYEYDAAPRKVIKERVMDDFADYREGKLRTRSLSQKIIDFFDRIINFFKTFGTQPSLKEELFKAIDAGKFKEYKVPENFKTESPVYKRIEGVNETLAYYYTQDMFIRASQYIFGKDNKEFLYDLQKLTGTQIYNYIKELYIDEEKYGGDGLSEKQFDELFKRTKNLLRTIGVKISDSETADINDGDTNNKSYVQEPFSTDWKKTSLFAIKILAATNPEVKPTNQQNVNSLKLPERMISMVEGYIANNFSKIFATLSDKLANTTNPDLMMAKLFELAKSDANYVRIFKNIGGDINSGVVNTSNFKSADWRLLINFFQTFSKQRPDALVEYISNNDVYTGAADMYTVSRQLQRDWFEGMKTLSGDPNSIISKKDKMYQVKKLEASDYPIKTPEEQVEFLSAIGIKFSLEDYAKLKTDQQNKFASAVSDIRTYVQDKSEIGTLNGRTLGINGQLTTLSELLVKVTNPNRESSYINVEGNKTSAYGENNGPSVFQNDINNVSTLEELLAARPELNDIFSKNNVTFRKGGLFIDDYGDKIKDIKVLYIAGNKNIDTDKGTSIVKLSEGQRFTQEINQNVQGNYYILIPGEGATQWMLNLGNPVSFEDFQTGRAWNEIYKIYREYLTDDVSLALDYKNRSTLKNVGSKAKDLRFFKDILSDVDENNRLVPSELLTKINELISDDETTQQDIETYIDNNSEKINEYVKKFIDDMATNTKNKLIENNQLVLNADETYRYVGLDNKFISSAKINKLNKFSLSENDITNILTFTNANYSINNVEFHKILFGDPYQFAIKNGNLEETKRIKSLLGSTRTMYDTTEFNTWLNDKFNKAGEIELAAPTEDTFGDIGYHQHKDYANTVSLADIKFGNSTYDNINEADAESVLIDVAYREVKLKNGQWSDNEAEPFHQWQMAYTRQNLSEYEYSKDARGEALRKHDEALLKTPEPSYVLDIIKPLAAGVKSGEKEINLVVDKMSQMPLYFKAVQGTNLEKLYTKMWKEQIDYVVFESGRKLGIEKTHSLYDANKNFNEAPFAEDTIVKVPWSVYGTQLETAYEYEKSQTWISQMGTMSSINMFDNGEPVGINAERKNVIKKEYERNTNIVKQLHKHGSEVLLKRLGLEDDGNGFTLKDPQLLAETLQHELKRRELSSNALDTIELDENGQFAIPFEASPVYKQIKDMLYSMINKSIISIKMTGGPKTQASVALWENAKEGRGIAEKTKDGYKKLTREEYDALPDDRKNNVVLTSDTLKFYEDEDGKRTCEIMLSPYFKDAFDPIKFPTEQSIMDYLNKLGEEGQEILRGVGARIPVQSMSSIEVFKVAKFLPKFMGDAVIVPSEITTKTNSDFDIDKLNTYLKSVYKDEKGNVRLIKYKGSEEATKQFYDDVFTKTIQSDIDEISKDDTFRNKLINFFNKVAALPEINRNAIVDSLTDDEYKFFITHENLLQTINAQSREADLSPSDYIISQVETKKAKLTSKLLSSKLREDYVDTMYKKALENEYYDSLEKLISLPENFKHLISPVDDAGLSDVAKKLDELRGENENTIKNRILDRNYMTSLRQSFVMAKKWVGIVAQNIKGQSITQKVKVYINPDNFKNLKQLDKNIIGNGSIILPHNTVTINDKEYVSISGTTTADKKLDKNGNPVYISNRLSGYATAVVDVVNNPFIMKIISSKLAVNTFMFLERIGCGEYTPMFMNQPIIKEYLKYIDAKGSTFLYNESNLKYIRSKFPTTAKDLFDAKIDIDQFEDNIRKHSEKGYFESSKDNATQQLILKEFLKYAKMADFSSKIIQSTNYDTSKSKSLEAHSRKKTKTEQARDTNIFSGVTELLESGYIGNQKELLDVLTSAIGAIMKLESPEFSIITNQVMRSFEEREFMSGDDYDEVASKMKATFLDYIIQINSNLNSQIQELMTSDDSVANQLLKAQKEHPEMKLLQDLVIRSSDTFNSAKTIKLNVNLKEAYDENLYIEFMRELKQVDNSLYNGLIKLAILQGSYQSTVSIKNIVPVEDYAAIIKPIIDSLSSTPEIKAFSKGMFQRANWKDEVIFPSFIPKFLPNVMNYGDEHYPIVSDEYGNEIYQYVSPAFPRINLPANVFGEVSDRRIILMNPLYNPIESQSDFIKIARTQYLKNGDIVDFATGQSIVGPEFRARKEAGDTSLRTIYGYQKVYLDGKPIMTKDGEHVYKLINLRGDGQFVSEHYSDFRPSVLNNGTVKIAQEIPDEDIIKNLNTILDETFKAKETFEPAPSEAVSGKKELFSFEKGMAQKSFRNKPLNFVDKIVTDKDTPVAMRNDRTTGIITVDAKAMTEKFNEKAWTTPAKQSDGSFATALPADEFSSANEWFTFGLIHEVKYDTILREQGETKGAYEDRINQAALEDLRKNYNAPSIETFDSLKEFTPERKAEILTNFEKKYPLRFFVREEIIEMINEELAKDREAIIKLLKDCY